MSKLHNVWTVHTAEPIGTIHYYLGSEGNKWNELERANQYHINAIQRMVIDFAHTEKTPDDLKLLMTKVQSYLDRHELVDLLKVEVIKNSDFGPDVMLSFIDPDDVRSDSDADHPGPRFIPTDPVTMDLVKLAYDQNRRLEGESPITYKVHIKYMDGRSEIYDVLDLRYGGELLIMTTNEQSTLMIPMAQIRFFNLVVVNQ